MLKKILLGLLVILVLIQFFRPEKNDSNDQTFALANNYKVPENVQQTLQVGCYDCHSNLTKYPWYSKVQPVAWWLNDHIEHGKSDLNFMDFTEMPIAVQNHKFEEIIEKVEEREMPLPSYTNFGLHKEANLSDEQRKMVIDWAKAQMNYLKGMYPADSLVMKRRKPADTE